MSRSTHAFTQSHHPVAYRTLTRFGRPFQQRSAKVMVSYSALGLPPQLVNRSTPRWHRRQPLPPTRFGLLPFRSPLLRESSLFFGVHEMFQFPHLPPPSLCVQLAVTGYHPGRVAPFGYPRIIARPPLPEAFRRLATSFVGLRRLGIHRVLFLRYYALRSITGTARASRPPAHIMQSSNACASPSDPSLAQPRQTYRARDAGNASFRMLLPCAHLLRCSGGAEGIRTPDLRRAKAALSRLSYSPIVKAASGRSWTRTTGLTLIRGVLSPTELNARSRHLGR